VNDRYISYECEKCGLIFIIPEDGKRKADVLQRFIACPLGHRPVKQLNIYEGMKECMEQTFSRLI
jgi:hypothetical protein